MALSYEEALATLTSMFSHPWTTDSLANVLRHFEGHMENTIEAILNHGDKDPEDLIARLSFGNGDEAMHNSTRNMNTIGSNVDQAELERSISMDEQIARQLASEEETIGKNRKGKPCNSRNSSSSDNNTNSTSTAAAIAASSSKKGKGTPTELPSDFLRIPGYNGSAVRGAGDDEALARMLQDELLQQELSANPEFAHLSRGSGGGGGIMGRTIPQIGFGGHRGGSFPGNNRGGREGGVAHEGPNIMDKLSEMGEHAKRRLTMLASQFNARQDGPDASNSMGAATQERRGLLDGGDGHNEEEVSFFGGERTNLEMKSMSPPKGSFFGGSGGKKED
eukprot:CAMPEP_0195519042 /NCGR_PEP_ID=MMETSP0794_2-20130614/14256_1 /TAXON_ID=515487 /ORGANISM="Stephanopyxis turris, Strain CCMP 815" /LENGTH=334 /DNA_ID=CAMNT_0040648125 /DNA_START=65 /DNA_END=1069 /DNA_ORIENTATION=+